MATDLVKACYMILVLSGVRVRTLGAPVQFEVRHTTLDGNSYAVGIQWFTDETTVGDVIDDDQTQVAGRTDEHSVERSVNSRVGGITARNDRMWTSSFTSINTASAVETKSVGLYADGESNTATESYASSTPAISSYYSTAASYALGEDDLFVGRPSNDSTARASTPSSYSGADPTRRHNASAADGTDAGKTSTSGDMRSVDWRRTTAQIRTGRFLAGRSTRFGAPTKEEWPDVSATKSASRYYHVPLRTEADPVTGDLSGGSEHRKDIAAVPRSASPPETVSTTAINPATRQYEDVFNYAYGDSTVPTIRDLVRSPGSITDGAPGTANNVAADKDTTSLSPPTSSEAPSIHHNLAVGVNTKSSTLFHLFAAITKTPNDLAGEGTSFSSEDVSIAETTPSMHGLSIVPNEVGPTLLEEVESNYHKLRSSEAKRFTSTSSVLYDAFDNINDDAADLYQAFDEVERQRASSSANEPATSSSDGFMNLYAAFDRAQPTLDSQPSDLVRDVYSAFEKVKETISSDEEYRDPYEAFDYMSQ